MNSQAMCQGRLQCSFSVLSHRISYKQLVGEVLPVLTATGALCSPSESWWGERKDKMEARTKNGFHRHLVNHKCLEGRQTTQGCFCMSPVLSEVGRNGTLLILARRMCYYDL